MEMSSQCLTCGLKFGHTSPVTLDRMQRGGLCELLLELPFDPTWGFTEFFLARSWTSALDYDNTHKQGCTNLVEKIDKAGCETAQGIAESYVRAYQPQCQYKLSQYKLTRTIRVAVLR